MKEIEEVLTKIIHKLTTYLERRKIIIRDDNDGGFQIPILDEDTLSKLQATSVTYRFATGKSKGKKAIVLKSVTDNDHTATKGLVAKNSGFSLHAGVATKAHERDRLEKVCSPLSALRSIRNPELIWWMRVLSKNSVRRVRKLANIQGIKNGKLQKELCKMEKGNWRAWPKSHDSFRDYAICGGASISSP